MNPFREVLLAPFYLLLNGMFSKVGNDFGVSLFDVTIWKQRRNLSSESAGECD